MFEQWEPTRERILNAQPLNGHAAVVRQYLLHVNNETIVDTGNGEMPIGEYIRAAHKQGLRRAPRTNHILVHPDWPLIQAQINHIKTVYRGILGPANREHVCAVEELVKHWLCEYRQAMIAVSQTNEKYITIRAPLSGEKSLLSIPTGNTVFSARRGLDDTGFLAVEEISQAADIFEGFRPDDRFRIHGATLGYCPLHCAIQWYWMLHAGQFLPMAPKAESMEYASNRKIINALKHTHAFKESTIRIGTQFDCEGVLHDDSGALSCEFDMMDSESRVIPGNKDTLIRELTRWLQGRAQTAIAV